MGLGKAGWIKGHKETAADTPQAGSQWDAANLREHSRSWVMGGLWHDKRTIVKANF